MENQKPEDFHSCKQYGNVVKYLPGGIGFMGNATLTCLDVDGKSESFVLTQDRMTIGRQGDILLGNASVSRVHAQVEARDGGWLLSDCGSRNGTKVNGVAVQRRMLSHGDIVKFGHVAMRFEVDDNGDGGDAETCTMTLSAVLEAMPGAVSALIGRSMALQEAMRIARRAAKSNATVLIFGESGTGKELFARLVYEESNRRGMPFIPVHSSAIEPSLLGSTLFGHEKGAFTGAVAQKKGLFEEADGGTIFLDEIGELSADMQVKLLRVLQEGEFMRVGGTTPIHVDVRVICATNRDLAAAVKEGKFREDLFYRLNVIKIPLPPLRERAGDVQDLVRHFIDTMAGRTRGISPEAMNLLSRYRWPGNVRELRNVVEQMLVLSDRDRLDVDDVPLEIAQAVADVKSDASTCPESDSEASGECLATVEQRYIQSVLRQCGGNKRLAAERLGISRSTLYEKLKEACPQIEHS